MTAASCYTTANNQTGSTGAAVLRPFALWQHQPCTDAAICRHTCCSSAAEQMICASCTHHHGKQLTQIVPFLLQHFAPLQHQPCTAAAICRHTSRRSALRITYPHCSCTHNNAHAPRGLSPAAAALRTLACSCCLSVLATAGCALAPGAGLLLLLLLRPVQPLPCSCCTRRASCCCSH
jgi:hypothetical protein